MAAEHFSQEHSWLRQLIWRTDRLLNASQPTYVESPSSEGDLIKTYEMILKTGPKNNFDSLHVINQVNQYRWCWRPNEVNILLLAESYVYTSDEDFRIKFTNWS